MGLITGHSTQVTFLSTFHFLHCFLVSAWYDSTSYDWNWFCLIVPLYDFFWYIDLEISTLVVEAKLDASFWTWCQTKRIGWEGRSLIWRVSLLPYETIEVNTGTPTIGFLSLPYFFGLYHLCLDISISFSLQFSLLRTCFTRLFNYSHAPSPPAPFKAFSERAFVVVSMHPKETA